jgi:putative PIN family toxin of toxin-antitoxin system
MRVVLDANIFVSSMINNQGNPNRIIEHWSRGDFEVLCSEKIIEEIGRVLRYPRIARRHGQSEEAIQRFMELLSNETMIVSPSAILNIVQDDESDNRYLECATEGRAQFIVSGDKHLLDLKDYRGITILSPAAFMTLLDTRGV